MSDSYRRCKAKLAEAERVLTSCREDMLAMSVLLRQLDADAFHELPGPGWVAARKVQGVAPPQPAQQRLRGVS